MTPVFILLCNKAKTNTITKAVCELKLASMINHQPKCISIIENNVIYKKANTKESSRFKVNSGFSAKPQTLTNNGV